MASVEKPLVYLVLGAHGSGRREIVLELIKDIADSARPGVMLPAVESDSPVDAGLPTVTRWSGGEEAISGTLPADATHVFFLTDGRKNPVDQVEAFKVWLPAQGAEIARVLTVVDCALAEKNPALLAWFEACVHFTDVVLLNRREGVENKWITAFMTHFKKQFYPCLFEFVKEGRVKNPALVLEPEARRMSHVFDAEQDWIFTDASGEEIDEQDEVDDEDEVEVKPEEDPYFARDAAGRRQKKIPDINKYLAQPAAE